MTTIIDRRLNPPGKSQPNRIKFIERAKAHLKEAVGAASRSKSVVDGKGGNVKIPIDSLQEPTFRNDPDYLGNIVLPGNVKFNVGDAFPLPPSGGSGNEGSDDGDGEDEFSFVLTPDEWMSLFFDDCELPDMEKRRSIESELKGVKRAGYSSDGSPSNLSVQRTARNSLSRRIALHRPSEEEVEELEAKLKRCTEDERPALEELLQEFERRKRAVAWMDPIDSRYRRFEVFHKPSSQAVMFCMMDVSGSMSEHKKDLSKRFFTLLHMFLKKQYQRVEVVFVRHTHVAQEVDEETFFLSRESGGTVVSTALEVVKQKIKDVYDPCDWNVYVAQASDGDNNSHDNPLVVKMLETLIPQTQYYAYLEVDEEREGRFSNDPGMIMQRQSSGLIGKSNIWETYEEVNKRGHRIAMRRIQTRADIYPVFKDMFKKQDA